MFDLGAAARVVDAFLEEHAPDTLAVRPDASDFEIVLKARRIANDVQLRTLGLESADALIVCQRTCKAYGIAMPTFPHAADNVARVKCELWWRRQMRKSHIRGLEHSNIKLHYVHYRKDPYASNEAVKRRIAQNARNQATLERVTMENEEGARFTLAELAEKSVANKALRRGELMTRLRGCEDLAGRAKFEGVMFTLTCPSRFHAVKQVGSKADPKFKANDKYEGHDPRAGQLYLRKVWQRIRAKLARQGVTFFGIRVAEPHHDGTPHWHGLVFSDNVAAFCAVMREHGLADSPDERGAQERRVKFELIDHAKGSAVGYVAKYIAKNIDGYKVGEHKTAEGYVVQADMLGDDVITPSQRVEAWAATWGIRQFQQFGGAPVTVWRELRRVKEESLPEEGTHSEAANIRAAWMAAQKLENKPADWAAFAVAMGGVAGEARRVRMHYREVMREGRYGITRQMVPQGVMARGVAFIVDGMCSYSKEAPVFADATRHEWKVVQRSGEAASTRTCVNNCTGAVDEGDGGRWGRDSRESGRGNVRHERGEDRGIEGISGASARRSGASSRLRPDGRAKTDGSAQRTH
ncbi:MULTISPECIES: replication endonuclease [unclassified Caballeronia]|uniref:replication endonuclease n=1 Tax=unclassified Caballeronia TaxID=2646786 RepID=UPI002028C01C|nr:MULTISPECIES: replication endonuclease [unclassified Caballeronia]